MKYIAAYLLAGLNSKSPSAADVEKILAAAGISVEKEKLDKIISEMKGKSIDEVQEAGREKMQSMPAGGAAPAAGAAAGGAAAGGAAAKAAEPEEESDEELGLSLFD